MSTAVSIDEATPRGGVMNKPTRSLAGGVYTPGAGAEPTSFGHSKTVRRVGHKGV